MHCYRICRRRHRALDGDGARRFGGRWNRPGRAVIYASSSRALAALELLAHVDRSEAPDDLVLLTLDIADTAPLDRLAVSDLPRGWQLSPAPAACQEAGEAWLAGGTALVLAVPSVLVPEEENLLLHPGHPEFAHVKVVAERRFQFDVRLADGRTVGR